MDAATLSLKGVLMTKQQALILVRRKFLEEQQGLSSGPLSDEYRSAWNQFPAVMTIAHHLLAFEVMKTP